MEIEAREPASRVTGDGCLTTLRPSAAVTEENPENIAVNAKIRKNEFILAEYNDQSENQLTG